MSNNDISQVDARIAVSNITLANANMLVCEVIRASVGNDSADPDANDRVLPLGVEDAVAARLASRLANRVPQKGASDVNE